MVASEFDKMGYKIIKNAIGSEFIHDIQNELMGVGSALDANAVFGTLDEMWLYFKKNNRDKGGMIYNAFKNLLSVRRLAISQQIQRVLEDELCLKRPILIDINCRIDTMGEEKYLFNWHQDYWFSMCSPNAVVIWIPVVRLTPELGGLQVIDNAQTRGGIFRSKGRVGDYHTYADAVAIDEDVSHFNPVSVQTMEIGDVLCFKFNLLHKSLAVRSDSLSRFTIQLRFADLTDEDFIANKYKPGLVNKNTVDYLIAEKK